ncbi:MAG TPA: SDR family oxidoreductase [Streptosporangiaceae bacterium]|jgi:NAD(P)-dependent dehydrogenase (short-subunit alcohol dehydrogenase family)
MADLSGRTFLVTGANTGIGLATARTLAARGGRVHLACRSGEKGAVAAAAITAETGNDQVTVLPLDLADLRSVRGCAQKFLALGEPLHVLVNNAGLAGRNGLTKDGFELLFGINHLGHFALTMALLDCLTASNARIVNVSSNAHYEARGVDFDRLRRPGRNITAQPEYAVSKLCNVLFTQELARRLAGTGVTSYALHPGVVASDIWRRVPGLVRPLLTRRMLSVEQGAETSLYCATSDDVATVSGRYYDKCAERTPSGAATPELGERLWAQSETWAGS